jgi:hypothetical protein
MAIQTHFLDSPMDPMDCAIAETESKVNYLGYVCTLTR